MAITKRLLKKKKRDSFKDFCGSLSRESKLSEVWRKIRAFKGFTNSLGGVSSFNSEWTEEFLCNLAPDYVQSLQSVTPSEGIVSYYYLVDIISLVELEAVLMKARDTAVCANYISYPMIRALPLRYKNILIIYYNKFLNGVAIPSV